MILQRIIYYILSAPYYLIDGYFYLPYLCMMFKNKHTAIFGLILALLITFSCKSKFEKLREGTDTGKKYKEALRLYNKKDYTRALILFDDLMQRYKGRSEAEDLAFYFAYTNYHLKN